MASLKTAKQINTNTNTPSVSTLVNNHNYSIKNKIKKHSDSSIFIIYHQNIPGISKKTEELLISLSYNKPQIICLTEHHLKAEEIHNINLDQYKLGTAFCRKKYNYGGACIYVSKSLQFNTINLEKYHKEKNLEICALKLNIQTKNFIIICIYRSPKGDFIYFLTKLEIILNELNNISNEFIICGDFNIHYTKDSSRKNSLDSILASFNFLALSNFLLEHLKILVPKLIISIQIYINWTFLCILL